MPDLGARRRAARGEPLRRLRQRPPLRARGLGQPGLDRGPRVHRARVVAVGDARHAVDGRRRGRRRPVAALRRRASTASPAARRCAPAAARAGDDDVHRRRRVRRVHAASHEDGLLPRPRRRVAARTPRSPSRSRSRCTASPAAACAAGQRVLVTGGGPIGALSVAAAPRPRRHRHRRERAAPEAPRARASGSARAVVAPDELVDAADRRGDIVDEPFDVALECSGQPAAMEAGARPAEAGAARSCSSARACTRPRFDPNRILLNELVDHRRVRLRRRRLRARARAARATRTSRRDAAHRARRRRRSTACSTRSRACTSGELAGQGHDRPVDREQS